MDARLAPYVPYPLFTEACRSWSKPPGQREYRPDVPRLRTNLQREHGLITHDVGQSGLLEGPRAPRLPEEKIVEMTEVKKHNRPWMIPGVGLSPACLRSSPAQAFSQVMPVPERTTTNLATTVCRPTSSVYTRVGSNSPLCRQQAFWQTIFSRPQVNSPGQHNTASTPQATIGLHGCESPTVGKQLQHQGISNAPNDVESSGGGSATTYFSDTSGIAYFLPSALSFSSSTRSSILKNSNDLFINTNAQSWGLGEWPSTRAVEEREANATGTYLPLGHTPSPAVLDSAHSYGWWDVLRTPFLVNTPTPTSLLSVSASPISPSRFADSMAQAQAQALQEVLLNVPSLASMTGKTAGNDTSTAATIRLQTSDDISSEGVRNRSYAPTKSAPPDMQSPPPRTTSLCPDVLAQYQAPLPQPQYASPPRYLMPTASPLQPTQQIHTESVQTNTQMSMTLQQQPRRPPIPMPVPIAPTDSYPSHQFANPRQPPLPSIASPMFFRTVLHPDIDNSTDNNATIPLPYPDHLPPHIPNSSTVSAPTLDSSRSYHSSAPSSKQKGMFSSSLERMKRNRALEHDRDRDGMDFCCRGIADEVVTIKFEPPPREKAHGRRAHEGKASTEGSKVQTRANERLGEVRRMPTVKELRETRVGHQGGRKERELRQWQGYLEGPGHRKEESLGKSVGRWMAGLLR
jgi:hypothetical protein